MSERGVSEITQQTLAPFLSIVMSWRSLHFIFCQPSINSQQLQFVDIWSLQDVLQLSILLLISILLLSGIVYLNALKTNISLKDFYTRN